MLFSFRMFFCYMLKVKIFILKFRSEAVIGLGFFLLEYLLVMRNIIFVEFFLEWRRICCNEIGKVRMSLYCVGLCVFFFM